jgi:ABC-type multidrug transport system ATPase subunit
MEEAEALSTKMGILVHGGIFRCMGTAHDIKNKFGSGYETLFKMKTLEREICD